MMEYWVKEDSRLPSPRTACSLHASISGNGGQVGFFLLHHERRLHFVSNIPIVERSGAKKFTQKSLDVKWVKGVHERGFCEECRRGPSSAGSQETPVNWRLDRLPFGLILVI